jgi:hypothetical protein
VLDHLNFLRLRGSRADNNETGDGDDAELAQDGSSLEHLSITASPSALAARDLGAIRSICHAFQAGGQVGKFSLVWVLIRRADAMVWRHE